MAVHQQIKYITIIILIIIIIIYNNNDEFINRIQLQSTLEIIKRKNQETTEIINIHSEIITSVTTDLQTEMKRVKHLKVK